MGTFCLPSDQKDMLSARQQYCQHFADSDCSIKNRLATSRPCHFSTTTNMGGVKGSRSTITGMRVMLFFALAYLAICGASVNAAPSTGQPSSKGGSGKASGNNENGVIPSHTTNRVPMDSPMQQTEAGRPKPVQTPNSQRAPTRAGGRKGFSSSLSIPASCLKHGTGSYTKVTARGGARRTTLRCNLGLRQADIHWYIGSSRLDRRFSNKHLSISRGRQRYGEFEILRNGNLRIRDLSRQHEGRYHCQAKRNTGASNNSSCSTIELRLKFPPRAMREMYRRRVLASGRTYTLDCKVRGYPQPSIVWMKDGRILGDSNDLKYTHHPDNSLTIHTVQPEDEGQYFCVASNEVDKARIKVQVTVVESPHGSAPVIIKSPRNRKAKLGGTVTFKCVAVGGNLLEINWDFHGENLSSQPLHLRHRQPLRLPSSDGLNTLESELVIPVVSENDVGQYTCTATNLARSTRESTSLSLTGT